MNGRLVRCNLCSLCGSESTGSRTFTVAHLFSAMCSFAGHSGPQTSLPRLRLKLAGCLRFGSWSSGMPRVDVASA